MLGRLYLQGCGTPRFTLLAFNLFNEAYNKGENEALLYLSICYLHGYGIEKDKKKALKYCQLAVKNNVEGAKLQLETIERE